MHLFKSKSLIALILCAAFITAATFWPRGGKPCLPVADLSWDVSGYYLYLPTIFYDDLGKVRNRQHIIDTYHPGGNDLGAYPCPNGNYIMKYSGGMAVMYFPGFLAGHFAAKYGHYPMDGFSYPYTICLGFYSLLIAIAGLWFIRKILLKYFSETVTAVALIALCAGTNYLNFAAMTSMLTHNYLFTLYAVVMYLTILWYSHPDYKKSVILGLLCGLAALTRPTDIIVAFIPLLWGLDSLNGAKERLLIFRQQYPKLLLFTVCAVCVGSIQLIYWKIYTGHFLYWSYPEDQGFNFLRVQVWHCLFSYKKGWFTYTPLMILSIIGFVPMYFQNRKIFWPILFMAFISLYITFAWKIWWYGGSFSMRAVIQYYTLLLFPFCAFIEYCSTQIWKSLLLALFMIACIWLNLVMTYQANFSYIMECDNMSQAYYWKIFGKLNIDRSYRRLINCPEMVPKEVEPDLKEIYRLNINEDTAVKDYAVFNGEKSQFAGEGNLFTPGVTVVLNGEKKGWYRIMMRVYLTDLEPNRFIDPTYWVVSCDSSGNYLKQNNYHIQQITDAHVWAKLPIDIHVESNKVASLKTYICCYSKSTMVYANDIRVLYSSKEK